jgi:phosphate transport system substrate-binding protein
MKRALAIVVLGLAAVAVGGCNSVPSKSGGGGAAPAKRITASGSSLVNPMMKRWMREYEKATSLVLEYNSTGSTTGIKNWMDNKDVFACSDAPLNEEQMGKAKEVGDFIHVPLVIGSVVPFYNLPDVEKPLHFTGRVLADIFLGKIKKWNDPALADLNRDVKLPDLDIAVVVRADGSGTSYIFTDYLSKVSEDWKTKVGVNTLPNWPIGSRAPKSDGVAGAVSGTKGAIGYVELLYAKDKKYGQVQNKAGQFVLASVETTDAAADNITEKDLPDYLRVSMTDVAGDSSYPICGPVFGLTFTRQVADKAAAVKEFFRWATHDGQKFATEEGYGKLPKVLIEKIDKKVDLIEGQ